ncbi:MAG: hypothetical protein GY814_01905 [Gammaproteobacteria bacterium]|nr:hypothetical protein [Gammaproteobacteria bacterium]
MRKIKEVLRLKTSGVSNRKIAQSCGVSRPTVGEYLQRATSSTNRAALSAMRLAPQLGKKPRR